MEKVTKVKKIYAELNEAQNRAVAKYGPVGTWVVNLPSGTSSNQRYVDRITEFLKVQKYCRTTSETGCYDTDFYNLTNNDLSPWNGQNKTPKVVLANGATFFSNYYLAYPSCNNSDSGYSIPDRCGWFYLDIDGANKGKNKMGIDVFAFNVTKDGIKGNPVQNSNTVSYHGRSALTWILETGNMDYLKANSSGKCNNSNKYLSLSNNVLSCK